MKKTKDVSTTKNPSKNIRFEHLFSGWLNSSISPVGEKGAVTGFIPGKGVPVYHSYKNSRNMSTPSTHPPNVSKKPLIFDTSSRP